MSKTKNTIPNRNQTRLSPWKNNNIQFPRLICELEAAGAITPKVMDDLCEFMDLTEDDIVELLERANKKWERIKSQC